MKKYLLAFLVLSLLALSYSAAVEKNYEQFTMYNLYGPQERYVQTDAKITNDVGFESTPKVLATNKYCPGNFNIKADVDGTWLLSSSNFKAISNYPQGNDESCSPLDDTSNPTKCPDVPIPYNQVSLNKPFDWLTSSEYSSVPEQNDFSVPVAALDTFHNEKIAEYWHAGNTADSWQKFTNRKGGVNLFCKGSLSLKLDNNLLNTQQIASETGYIKNIGVGSHTIKSELSGVECFSAIKKLPEDDGFFRIYRMKKWTPSLTGTSSTSTFVVADPELKFDAEKVYPLENQMQIEAGESIDVFFEFENKGDVIFTVNEVSAGAGTTAGFTVEAAPNSVFYPPSLSIITNGFNKEIAPGASKTIGVRVTAPDSIPNNPQIKIKFKITADEKTCAEAADGANINPEGYEFKWFTFNYTFIPLPTLKSCEFVPTSKTVEVNDIANYTLYCYDQLIASPTKQKVNCLENGMEIEVNPQSVGLLAVNPQQSSGPKTDVKVLAVGVGTATITADNNIPSQHVTCSATMISNPEPLPVPDSCTLQKSAGFSSNAIGLYSVFVLTCFKNGQKIDCPGDTSTLNIGATNGIVSYYAYSSLNTEEALVSFKNLKYGSGMVSVSEKAGKYSCSAPISLTPSSLSYCSLEPIMMQTEVGKTGQFNITCNEVGVDVPCKSVSWNAEGVASLGATDKSKAQVTFNAEGSATITANVQGTNGLPLNYECSATAQASKPVQNDTNQTVVKSCAITPGTYSGYVGSRGDFELTCYENPNTKKQKIVSCLDVEWYAQMKSKSIAIMYQNSSSARIRFNEVGSASVRAITRHSTCDANAFISAAPVQKDLGDACEITVIEKTTYGDPFSADLRCYNSTSGKDVPCENVTWALEDGHGTINGNNYGATCTLTGNDVIVATIDGEAYYVCKLSVGESKKKCTISPMYWIASPLTKKDFTVKCGKEECDNADWGNSYPEYIRWEKPDVFNDSKVSVEVYKDPKKQITDAVMYVNAEYEDEKYYCEAEVYIGALMCVNYI